MLWPEGIPLLAPPPNDRQGTEKAFNFTTALIRRMPSAKMRIAGSGGYSNQI